MEAPPNFGDAYTREFRGVYRDLAAHARACRFVPFLLEGVAGIRALNQADGIHPNAEGRRHRRRPRLARRSQPMLDRPTRPHDRAARRLEDRHERHARR